MNYELKQVVVELTERCNLACLHCGSACLPHKIAGELSVNQWKKVVKQLVELKVEKIVFSGGEPFLKPGVNDLFQYCHDIGMKFGVITNGFSLKLDTITFLASCRPFAVGVSLDGFQETHDYIRGNTKSWRNAINTISNLKQNNIQVCVVTTINRLSYRSLLDFGKWLNLAEVDSWQLQLAMPFGRMKDNQEFLIDEVIFKKVCEDVFQMRHGFPDLKIEAADCFGLAPPNSIRSGNWSGCSAGLNSLGINAGGYVSPCFSLRSGFGQENVLRTSIKEIWETSEIFNFNRNFSATNVCGTCADCQQLEFCRGGCASQSESYYGQKHQAPFCFFKTFNKKGGKNV